MRKQKRLEENENIHHGASWISGLVYATSIKQRKFCSSHGPLRRRGHRASQVVQGRRANCDICRTAGSPRVTRIHFNKGLKSGMSNFNRNVVNTGIMGGALPSDVPESATLRLQRVQRCDNYKTETCLGKRVKYLFREIKFWTSLIVQKCIFCYKFVVSKPDDSLRRSHPYIFFF